MEAGDVGGPRVWVPLSAGALGAAVGLCGQVLINAAVYGFIVSQGGSMTTDIEAGGRFAMMMNLLLAAPPSQLLLLGLLAFVTHKRSRPFASGAWIGWAVGLLAAMLWWCG